MTPQSLISRFLQIAVALIPACTGIFNLLNNIQGKKSTLANVIAPLLSMKNVYPEFMHSWRAIDSGAIQSLAFYFLASCEALVGLLAIIGIVKMLTGLNSDDIEFGQRQAWVRAACAWGLLVWGLGFYVFAGDFFLAWQSPSLGGLQAGGLNYMLMMAVPYFFLKMHEKTSTI
jgi:predicted small integral membrane protein